jgi:hypothetical protein
MFPGLLRRWHYIGAKNQSVLKKNPFGLFAFLIGPTISVHMALISPISK